jgi:hypothetical protein
MKLLVGLVVFAGMACAQSISVGVLGGVPFTDAVNTVNNSSYSTVYKSTNFIVGPSLQVNLPASLRLEFDALYRPVKYQATTVAATNSISASQWQFPLLMQYRFKTPRVKPFVEAGVQFDHLSGLSQAATQIASGAGQVLRTNGVSVVLGGGVDVKIPFVRLSGELRFAHEAQQELQSISNLNQAEVIFGVHF